MGKDVRDAKKSSPFSLLRRPLAALYWLAQNNPAFKRVGVRLLMRFPTLGSWALRTAGAGAAAANQIEAPSPDTLPHPVYAPLYRRYGYPALQAALAAPDTLDSRYPVTAPEPEVPLRQLFIEISGLVERDAYSGIPRVVRNLTQAMVALDLPGWRVEPVYARDDCFRYAHRYLLKAWGLPDTGLSDELLVARPGDVFLGLDLALAPSRIPPMRGQLDALRQQGVGVHFVVYDLLPVLHPEFFSGEIDPRFLHWLQTVVAVADGISCISQAVAHDVERWVASDAAPPRDTPPRIGWFHLGAELDARPPATVTYLETQPLPPHLGTRPCLLMVGTIEPRKGHQQALDAFERLWADGADIDLVVIGRPGWNVKPLSVRMRNHPEAGKRLHWLDNADDATLRRAYAAASGLLAASWAEGFGLPLIEAAHYQLPVLARDLPVFREIAGEHAWYFHADTPEALAVAVAEWVELWKSGHAPASDGMPWLTWEQSARQLLAAVLPDTPTAR